MAQPPPAPAAAAPAPVMPPVVAVPPIPVQVQPAPPPPEPAAAEAPKPAPPVAAPPPAAVALRPPSASDPVRVAILLPMTAANANLGRALLDAAQLALYDSGADTIELLPRDTGDSPEAARRAAEAALSEGAQIILGPLFASAVSAAAEPARSRGVAVIGFSNDRAVAGNGVYLLGVTPDQQIARVVAFASQQGLRRYAALIPQSAYGEAVASAIATAAQSYGAGIVRIETYPTDTEEPRDPILRLADYNRRRAALADQRQRLASQDDTVARQALKRLEGLETLGELPFDSIFLPEGGARLKRIAPLLAYYDIDPARIRFLGTAQWDDASLGREPSLVGGWYAAPPPEQSGRFFTRFTQVFGNRPPRIATHAYDAVALAVVLSRAQSGPDFSATAITSSSGFAGVDGIFRFRPDGVAERGLAVIEVTNTGARVISRAPDTFQRLSN
jgi:ABC-type branched-subunit amino acid transport system substrate-binding protein